MRTKRCKLCGCFIYDDIDCNICDCCLDEMAESESEEEYNGSREDLREQD